MGRGLDIGRQSEGQASFSDQYDSAVRLLKLVEVDYRRAREELEEVGTRFAEREIVARRQLDVALDAADRPTAASAVGTRKSAAEHRPDHRPRRGDGSERPQPTQSTPTMEVCCLGIFQVRVGSKKVMHWPSLKAKSLLEYLVAEHSRPLPKELVMETLWPGCEPALANNNLKAAVRALRHTLAFSESAENSFAWIVFRDGSYMVNPAGDLWCDVDSFEHHWLAALTLEKQGKHLEALREHETAEAMYKGDYLEDNLYEDWTNLRREALKDTYLAILSILADKATAESDHQGCINYCQRILRRDPCREDAYQRLMQCYSRLGQRSRAIAWYRICEKTLGTELDILPDRQTTGIYQTLLNGQDI